MTLNDPNAWAGEPDLNGLRRARAMMKVDKRQALEELEDLANRGSLMSMIYLGWEYRDLSQPGHNLDQAEFWFRRATNGGSLLGSFYLGDLFRNGRRFSEALETYSIGAARDYPPSLYRLGVMYRRGEGVSADWNKARQLWAHAATLGHVYAKRDLAIMLMSGRAGFLRVPGGVFLWANAIASFTRVFFKNPKSDLLR